MKPEAQRIAIAEACGWRNISNDSFESVDIDARSVTVMEGVRGTFNGRRGWLPDYLTDLNAMHEAEGVFIGPKEWGDYCDKLRWVISQHLENVGGPGSVCGIVCLEMAVGATAAQRAEAFLRTINKWEET